MAGPAQYKASLWDVAFSQLPEDQQRRLKSGLTLPLKFVDLKTSIGTAQEHAASKWRFKTRHGEIDIREKFGKIVSWVQKFIEIGDVAVNYDPGHAALPWAALRLVFQVMVNNTTRAVKFVEGLEQVAFYIYDSTVRENLYLTAEPSEDGNDLKNHILALYAIILRFLLQARLFFEASSTRRLLSSSIKSADEVVHILGSAVQQANQVLNISGRLDTRNQISTSVSVSNFSDHHAESMAWLKEQAKGNDLIISNLMNSIASKHQESMAHFDSAEKRYEENFRLEILNWLSTIPYQRHHKSAFGEVLKGTGSWFLEDSAYQNWKDGDESAVLWVHGIPGSGKSKLTSLAIQTELENSQRPLPLYFYCSCTRAEPERATAEGILRSLVKQISSGGASGATNAIPGYVLEKYKEAKSRGFASGELMSDECYDIIARFVIDTGEVRILIDALDECDEDARTTLIDALNTILEESSPSIVKILISSRDSPHLVSFFDQHKTYEIHVASHRNQHDIEQYVRHELNRLILRKRFLVGGKPPSAKLQHYIITRLCDDVQGMFRWVSLQLDYMCTLRTAGDIKRRLGRLPKSLSDSYDELYQKRTKSYEPAERKRLEVALTLLLVQVRPTNPGEFTHLVHWDQEGRKSSENEDGTSISDDDDISDWETDSKEEEGVGGESASWKYESITSLCFNLVVFDSTTGFFRLAHTSVQDYLLHRNPNFKTPSQNYARLAEHHLSRLLYTLKLSSQEVYPKYSGKIPGLFDSRPSPESEDVIENSIDFFRDFWYFDVPTSAFTSSRGRTIRGIETRWANYVAESGECRHSSPLKDMQAELLDLLVNQPWQYVRPWLFFSACTYGLRNFVETSIKAHAQLARIAQRYPYQTTALRETCMHDQSFPEIVKIVIENDNGFHSLQGSPLCSAVGNGHFAIAEMLLDKDPGLISRKDIVSPLGWALSTKQTETMNIIRLLMERGADVQEVHREYVGSTPLHLAAENQGPEVLKILLDNGALVNAPDFHGLSPLVAAISRDTNLDNCRLLVDHGADITIRDPRGGTPLEAAARHNKVDGVKFLLDHHVDVNTANLGSYGTALHFACHKGHEGIAEELLASGADPNIINIYGNTALSVAVQNAYWQIVKLLLPHSSTKILNVQDAYGYTPMVHAARKGHVETVKLLLEAGAEIIPRAPGPDCPFLSPEDRVAGYARDAFVVAWRRNHSHILRILLQTAAKRDPGGDYEEVLRLLDVHEEKPVGEWSLNDDATARTEAVRVHNRATETLDDWVERRSRSAQSAQQLDYAATRDGILERIGRMTEESERKITGEMKREYTWWKPAVEVKTLATAMDFLETSEMRTDEDEEE